MNTDNNQILVTSPLLPDLQEFNRYLQQIWDSKWITNSTRVLKLTKNTYCIHHFAGSWVEKTRFQLVKEWIFANILGRKLTDKLVKIKRFLLNGHAKPV